MRRFPYFRTIALISINIFLHSDFVRHQMSYTCLSRKTENYIPWLVPVEKSYGSGKRELLLASGDNPQDNAFRMGDLISAINGWLVIHLIFPHETKTTRSRVCPAASALAPLGFCPRGKRPAQSNAERCSGPWMRTSRGCQRRADRFADGDQMRLQAKRREIERMAGAAQPALHLVGVGLKLEVAVLFAAVKHICLSMKIIMFDPELTHFAQ